MTQRTDENLNTVRNLDDLLKSQHLFVVLFLALAFMMMFAIFTGYHRTLEDNIVVLPSAPIIRTGEEVVQRSVTQRYQQSPGPYRVGIIVGHRNSDPGAVCADGLREVDVNQRVGDEVIGRLRALGIETDLLDEFDGRLNGYLASALVSLHADSCGNDLTGFKAASMGTDQSNALQICVEQKYQEGTGLSYNANTITPNMTAYHVYNKVSPNTPTIILEMGFLSKDRALLMDAKVPAEAITRGILCFLDS